MMRLIKNTALALLLCLSFVAASAQSAEAAWNPFGNVNCGQANDSAVCEDRDQRTNPIAGSDGVIIRIVNIIALIGGIAVVIFIVLAGLRMVTSGGSSDDVAGARRTLIYAIVGLIIIILARTLVVFVLSKL